MVCAGKDFHGTFHDCTFHACQLYAVHGAAVTLRNCTLRDSTRAIVASGPGTAAAVLRCRFWCCVAPLCADRGAALVVSGAHIRNGDSAVTVNDTGTHASLSNCVIDWMEAGVSLGVWGSCGVSVRGGAACVLRGCTFHRYLMTVFAAYRESWVEAVRCRSDGCQDGVTCAANAWAMLRDVHLESHAGTPSRRHTPFAGVAVGIIDHAAGRKDGGARIQMERCTTPRAVHEGVVVSHGSQASLLLCDVCCAQHGVTALEDGSVVVAQHCEVRGGSDACAAQLGASMRLESCTCTSPKTACRVGLGARLAAVDTRFRGRREQVPGPTIHPFDESTLRLLRCEVSDGVTAAVVSQSSLRMVDSVVCVLQPRGEARPQGVTLMEDSRAEIMGCEFKAQRCGFLGAHGDQCALPLRPAVSIGLAAGAALTGCRFHEFPVVVQGKDTDCVIRDSVFEGVPRGGNGSASASLGASLRMECCQFREAKQAVYLSEATCSMHDCSFGPRVEQAVAVHDASTVEVKRCRFVSCRDAVRAQRRTSVLVEDSECVDTVQGFYLIGSGLSLVMRRVRVSTAGSGCAVGVVCENPDGTCTAELEDCTLRGGTGTATFCATGVSVKMLRCELFGAEVGVTMTDGVAVSMQECRVEACASGATVGWGANLALERCERCGARGPAGWRSALAALRGDDSGLDRAPRCMHEGAVARLTLEDVEFAGCSRAGLCVGAFGHVAATRVRVTGSRVGLQLERIGAGSTGSTFTDCIVKTEPAAGQVGVVSARVCRPGAAVQEGLPDGVMVLESA